MASPETRAFLKQSRERIRSSSEHRGDTPIHIYESPTPTRSVSRSPGSPSLDHHIRIVCADGHELLVPRVVALRSGCIRHMLEEGVGAYRERIKRVINLPSLSSATLERVFQFCSMDVMLNRRTRGARRALFRSTDDVEDDISPMGSPSTPLRCSLLVSSSSPSSSSLSARPASEQVIAFCFPMSPESVLELLAAAHFLDIPELLSATCRMVADHIDDVDSLDGLPADAVMQILELLPADKLAGVELHKKFVDLPDTTHLWRMLFHERGLSTDEWLHQASWSARARALGRFVRPDLQQAQQWKSAVLAHALQDVLNGLSESSMPSLHQFAANASSYLTSATLPPQLLEDDFLSPVLESLPALRFIDLSGCTIAPYISVIRDIVHGTNTRRPTLSALRLSETSLTDDELASLLTPVPSHLELLDVCNNALTTAALPLLISLVTKGRISHLGVGGHSFDTDRLGEFFRAALLAPHLKLLDLGDTPCRIPRLSEDDWQQVHASSVMEQLFLNDTIVANDNEAFAVFCAHLPPRLDHLSLRSIGLRALHVQIMAQHAPKWTSMVSLDIGDNYLNKDAAPFLQTMLLAIPSLTSFDVSINCLGDVGGRALAQALSAPSCALRHLNVSGTELRGGSVDLAAAATRPTSSLVWLAMDAPPQISARLTALFAQRPSLRVIA